MVSPTTARHPPSPVVDPSSSQDPSSYAPAYSSTIRDEPAEETDVVRELPPSRKATQGSIDNVDSPTLSKNRTNTEISNASSKIPESWLKQYVLCFDGGGIRGYSSLLILRALMTRIREIEEEAEKGKGNPGNQNPPSRSNSNDQTNGTPIAGPPTNEDEKGKGKERENVDKYVPCHYFDYIGGTSTGGLISIMLGRLRMGVEECIAKYSELGGEVFGHPRLTSIRGPIPAWRDKYDPKRLKRVIESVVESKQPRLNKESRLPLDPLANNLFSSNELMCRTIVVAYKQKTVEDRPDLEGEPPFLFRSYTHRPAPKHNPAERNPSLAHAVPIWQIARATSAAPTYFPPIIIDNRKFGDGGFGSNNPAKEVYWEVSQMCGDNNSRIALLVSVGTGASGISRFAKGWRGKYYAYFKAAKKLASDSQVTHEDMQRITRNRPNTYFRFNVKEGLGEMKLDEWNGKTLEYITEMTDAYLEDDTIQTELQQVAEILVKARKERVGERQWETFRSGTMYRCAYDGCTKLHKVRYHADDLRKHLKRGHGLNENDVERYILDGRLAW